MAKYKVRFIQYQDVEVEAEDYEDLLRKARSANYGQMNSKEEIIVKEVND